MKRIAYITPAVRVKNVAPLSLMQFSNNGDGTWVMMAVQKVSVASMSGKTK